VAGRLVLPREVERAIAVGPHPGAVAADDQGEIAGGLRVGRRGKGNPALVAFTVAVGLVAAVVPIEIIKGHALGIGENHTLIGLGDLRGRKGGTLFGWWWRCGFAAMR